MEKTLKVLISDENDLEYELKTSRNILKAQIESQKAFVGTTIVSDDSVETYVSLIKTALTLLVASGFFLAMCTGGMCAYFCNKKFCSVTRPEEPKLGAHTIDMKFVPCDSPGSSPESRGEIGGLSPISTRNPLK